MNWNNFIVPGNTRTQPIEDQNIVSGTGVNMTYSIDNSSELHNYHALYMDSNETVEHTTVKR